MNKQTHELLARLTAAGISQAHAHDLRRIAMTLHRWHELECGTDTGFFASCVVRGWKTNGSFEYADDGRAYMEVHPHTGKTRYESIPDRETGAKKRLAKIMASYPVLTAYIQGDPRGASLYILRTDDIPPGASIDSCYSRGIAVYR